MGEPQVQLKKVKEIFSDYKTRANIMEAKILGLNLLKKKKILELIIESDEYIEIKELWYLEKYLRERFLFENIELEIKYTDDVRVKSVEEEWTNLICYMTHKYPLAKPMLLLKSKIEASDKIINVKMHIRGAEFLKAKKTDVILQKMIKNILGKDYKIELEEDIDKEEIRKYHEKMRKQEEEEIQRAQAIAESMQHEQNSEFGGNSSSQYQNTTASSGDGKSTNSSASGNSSKQEEYNDPDYRMPTDMDGYMPPQDMPPEDVILENSGELQYIMGKPSKAKEKKVKIKDITANDGRVTLEGRIISNQARETKSGKGMIILELYDGTGTITCKSFAKDIKEGNEIVEKIKNAKAIKLIGKAGLDKYVGDVTVIANTIIETDSDVPELPTEAEDTPLIYGNNVNITEPLVKIENLGVDDGKVCIDGEVIGVEEKPIKNQKVILSIDIYDGTSTMTCKAFVQSEQCKKVVKRLKRQM